MLKGKRANGEGTIYRRKDGRWAAAVSLDRGRRKHFLGRTREEVARKLAVALKARQDGLPLPNGRQTVAQFLSSWLGCVRPSLRPRTWLRYEQYVRVHIIPEIGRVSLARLTPQHLQLLYGSRLEAGLSPTTVRHVHTVLHGALEQAARWGLVARNVADLALPPRAARHEMATLSPEQARMLLETAASERLEALYVLALSAGLRQGELLALRWRDINFDAGSVQVRGSLQRTTGGLTIAEPKTARSRRLITLTAAAANALRRHRSAQAKERLRLGAIWEDNDLVFANEIGRPIEAGNLLRRSFWPLLERAGLPHMRFHDLRHTAATLMLGQGVHPKVVAEMLGHSQISVTLDLYSHVTPTMQQQAARAMDSVLKR